MARTLDLDLTLASTAIEPYTGSEHFDPYSPTTFLAANGFLLLLSGTQENMRIALPDEDATNPCAPLVMEAPSSPLFPLTSGVGTGAVFGENLKWAYRYKNGRTGEVSGLSPLDDEGLNLGAEVFPGSIDYLGQIAYFNIPGTAIPGVDTIEVFRNTSNGSVLFKIDEVANPGSGSYVMVTDNNSDEDIIVEETSDLSPNMAFIEGRPYPCAKGTIHATGRTAIYGLVRRATIHGSGDFVADQAEIESTSAFSDPAYIGFRLIPESEWTGASTTGPIQYRVVGHSSSGNLVVYPPIREEDIQDTNDRRDTWDFLLVDDRDGRTVWLSTPGKPWSYTLLDALTIGTGKDDDVLHFESAFGASWGFTRRAIYQITDDGTEAPALSYRQKRVVNEGTFGLRSTVLTPFGFVFANERGVRVFDGTSVRALGSASVFEDFLPSDQWATIQKTLTAEVFVTYNPDTNLVYVSFPPTGAGSYERALVFDPQTGAWRLWRIRIWQTGTLRNDGGDDVFIFGDDYGNLSVDEEQELDVMNASYSTLPTKLLTYGANSNSRAVKSTELTSVDLNDLFGVPVIIDVGGTYTHAWIAGPSPESALEIVFTESLGTAPSSGQPLYFGAIEWTAETAYLDGGEPIQPKELQTFRLRYRKPTARSGEDYEDERLKIEVSAEEGSYVETASTTKREDIPATSTYYRVRADKRGRSFQAKFSGVSQQNEPQITAVVADIDVRAGE